MYNEPIPIINKHREIEIENDRQKIKNEMKFQRTFINIRLQIHNDHPTHTLHTYIWGY